MGLADGMAWEDEFGWDDDDIEELDSSYEDEKEYIELTNAYTTVATNIAYYPEDQLHNLLDLITRTLSKG